MPFRPFIYKGRVDGVWKCQWWNHKIRNYEIAEYASFKEAVEKVFS